MAIDWQNVVAMLNQWSLIGGLWKADQHMSVQWVADRIKNNRGLLIADEVGLGKTRIAVTVALAVIQCGGRVAILIPPGLADQWSKEFQKYRDSLAESGDSITDPSKCFLRKYEDMFLRDERDSEFLCTRPLVFVSHRFGVPQNLSDNSQESKWLFPMRVKRRLVNSGNSVKGLGAYLNESQDCAATDLVKRIKGKKRLVREICESQWLKLKHGAKVFSSRNSDARGLFQRIIGEFIGPIDLLIIDEAHKNRRGAEGLASPYNSRLSECINNIFGPVSNASMRRLGLTATPLELGTSQWRDILTRIGLDRTEVDNLCVIADKYANVIRETNWFDGMTLENLKCASKKFETSFSTVVSRRRWRDHEVIKRFAALKKSAPWESSPHRELMPPCQKSVGELSQEDKDAVFASECIAEVCKGRAAKSTEKTQGYQYSQAQDSLDVTLSEDENDFGASLEPRQDARRKYWIEMRSKSLSPVLRYTEPQYWLQQHPRIMLAIELIEPLIERSDSKVLVFGAFNAPLIALTRALNIRNFLRDVKAGQPTLLPARIRDDSPDLKFWAKKMGVDLGSKVTGRRILRLRAEFERDRKKLHRHCQAAYRRVIGARLNEAELDDVANDVERKVVSWLAFSLPAYPINVDEEAESLLRQLFDIDPPESESRASKLDEVDDDSPTVQADHILRCVSEEVDFDSSNEFDGNAKSGTQNSSPRGGIARMMYGETEPLTRRTLQYRFNQQGMYPRVLIAQAAVASEGLNLHEACSRVLLFHLDWNPAKIEQQIGRVDRQESYWMKQFEAWEAKPSGQPPRIEIYTLSLAGTYDDKRRQVVTDRRQMLRSQLFGEFAPSELLRSLSLSTQAQLSDISPDLRPCVP